MFDECVIRGRRFAPARFCGPLVGYTHSAFRRLIAELGGCGAIWTEMLGARHILGENVRTSPWLRRPHNVCQVYQLMLSSDDPIERVLGRLEEAGADALDLNLGCHSKSVRNCLAGTALFEDVDSLRKVLVSVRKYWPHMLTAKIRLGREHPDWQIRFLERVRLLEDAGVDAITLHARFAEEKFKRRARHELFPWAASLTRLPLIANGDLAGTEMLQSRSKDFQSVSAIMVGRMALARPWIFASWDGPQTVDYWAIWEKMYNNVIEDFPPNVALRRMLMFTKYFAANFKFGHQFKTDLGAASSLEEMRDRAEAFLSHAPATVIQPTVAGL